MSISSSILTDTPADTSSPRNFQVSFTETSAIVCSATRLEGVDKRPGFLLETYIAEKMDGEALLDWARRIIETALVRQ